MNMRESVTERFRTLQDHICLNLENFDGSGRFQEDLWQREGGGGGRTRIILGGDCIEKGGVNFSAVHGNLPDKIAAALQLPSSAFYATGVSIVLHPHNPLVPIIHMNVRYFETDPVAGKGEKTWWFGGGIDLTPHYIIEDQATFFHQSLKTTCDHHDPAFYPKFKKWADDYFYINHRKETRGIGGIFFDRLNEETSSLSADKLADFVMELGYAFAPIYLHIAGKNRHLPFSAQQKEWQNVRRGRYVEFNLVYDKGTKFGLETDGRIESILMSLPQNAQWFYNYQVSEGSPEAHTQALLKKEIDWISLS